MSSFIHQQNHLVGSSIYECVQFHLPIIYFDRRKDRYGDECSSGDIAIFQILFRKKKKTGSITSAGFYIVPYYVRGRVITIFLELERCYISPQVWELCMATRQKCIPCSYITDTK